MTAVGAVVDRSECRVAARGARRKELRAVRLYHRDERVGLDGADQVVRARAGVADGRRDLSGELPLDADIERDAVRLLDVVIERAGARRPGRERDGTRERRAVD